MFVIKNILDNLHYNLEQKLKIHLQCYPLWRCQFLVFLQILLIELHSPSKI